MPSPFPGMDPYLEKPSLWPDVHHELISEVRAYLHGIVRPKYYVSVEERLYLTDEDDPENKAGQRVADLRVGQHPGQTDATIGERGTATLEVAQPIELTFPVEEEIREAFLQVFDAESRQVVAVIEILSPSNKSLGSRGRASFEQKRQEILNSASHWVEIDLLRAGAPSVPRELLPPSHYAVHVLRIERRPQAQSWPIHLRQRLPVIAIPLKSGDADAALDLQSVFTSAFDRAAYDARIDYRAVPVPPLESEDAAWADQWLKGKGVR